MSRIEPRHNSPVGLDGPGSAPLIQMEAVTKVFRTTAGEVEVLKGIHVDLWKGEFVGVVGRSGSGKSTLANMLTGIDHPTSGSVRVAGQEIHRMREGAMSEWRGRTLGIVFQFFQLLPMLTLVENVMLPMDFCNLYAPAERESRAMSLLKRVGLERSAFKLPGQVSGGQQQSAAVARALANDPPILVADEPTGNLDSRTAEEVMQLFEELVEQGKTILMVTHDRELAKRTGRILLISDGELIHPGLARALPDVPHPALLVLTHQTTTRSLRGGEAPDSGFLAGQSVMVVSEGNLEVTGSAGQSGLLAAGMIFSRAGLEMRWGPGAAVRAAAGGAQVLVLDLGVFRAVLGIQASRYLGEAGG